MNAKFAMSQMRIVRLAKNVIKYSAGTALAVQSIATSADLHFYL
jgi:hypothetical protein